jgi:hypothetical protein
VPETEAAKRNNRADGKERGISEEVANSALRSPDGRKPDKINPVAGRIAAFPKEGKQRT